jgi:hypothetical protein
MERLEGGSLAEEIFYHLTRVQSQNQGGRRGFSSCTMKDATFGASGIRWTRHREAFLLLGMSMTWMSQIRQEESA